MPRPHLTTALGAAKNVPLVLVSAPAGSGKTGAVADWARSETSGTVCWVTFEDGDVSFWDVVLESLRRQGLGVPASWTAAAGGGLGPRRLGALAGLVVGASQRLTVVVDGYELGSLQLAREVDHLLRHSLGHICLVFVGRVDPILPLYRYRLTDSVLEIRAADLAFSDEEAALLLKSMDVELGGVAVHDLNQRVSGWVAGLTFAARALQGRDDAEEYVATVVEQTTDINEYLVAEVLDAQPPEVRRFLLDTCATTEFCADLAALIGGASAVHTMRDLENHRAFLEPVPGRPGYFHYYPFFRRLLLAQLAHEAPERLVEVRRITSGWHRDHGRHAESLGLLATIGAWPEVATQLVHDGLIGRLLLEEQGSPLAEVARRLPASLDLPAAAVVRAATALRQGEPAGKDRCARELTPARRALRGEDIDPRLVVAVAVTDALRACLTEDLATAEGVVAEAERLLAGPSAAPVQGDASEVETILALAGGIVALRRGDLAEAHAGLARAVMPPPGGAAAAFRADCLGHLAVADALQGELAAAVRHADEALSIANQAGLGSLEVPPSAHVALAWVGVERCDVPLTTEHVTAARSSRALPADPFCSALVEAATATLEESTGHAERALDRLVRAAEASASRDPWVADHLRVEAAWLSLREDAPARALAVLDSVAVPDRPEVAVAAAACAEQGSPGGMSGLPVRDGVAPLGTQVRALLVRAGQTAHDRSPRQAGPVLARALRLASQQQLRRPFRECGASLRPLLDADPGLAREHYWLHHVGARTGPSRPPASHEGLPAFVEPLTPKELEVLGHLARLLTTEEIAAVLFVSVNTVRTHIRKILRKLGVNRRNAAIRRARELGLLED